MSDFIIRYCQFFMAITAILFVLSLVHVISDEAALPTGLTFMCLLWVLASELNHRARNDRPHNR